MGSPAGPSACWAGAVGRALCPAFPAGLSRGLLALAPVSDVTFRGDKRTGAVEGSAQTRGRHTT